MSFERFMDRKRKDEDLAQEIDSHLAHERDANAARGLSPEEARRQANLKFGNPRSPRERVWRYRSLPWVEMALALVLVIGAALLIRTFLKLQAVDPGFDTHNVLTMSMSISGNRFQKTAGVAR
jgi:hypothetical protein